MSEETNTKPGSLEDFLEMSRDEKDAFLGWFHGGLSHVVKYGGREDVNFGKCECQLVDFEEFWLGKMQELGWFTVRENDRFIAKGIEGEPESIEYRVEPTEAGRRVRDEFYAKGKKSFLLIGGQNDGARMLVPETPDRRIYAPIVRIGEDVPTEQEVYERKIFACDGVTVEVYAIAGMSDLEVMRRLLEGYGRNDEPSHP